MTSIPYKFYLYQKDRFPILLLLLSLLPVTLSSAAVVSMAKPNSLHLLLALLTSIAYLLHIRIVDEHRDFHHDSTHHKDRPVQTGIISLEELRKIDLIMVFAMLAIAFFSSIYSFGISVVLLIYTFFAGKEFFLGEKIRGHFFLYNTVNLVQMFLLQILVYSFFTKTFSIHSLVITHFLFTGVGAVMFEFLRKIKTLDTESTGKDTYTWYFGFTNSIVIYMFLALINVFLFFKVIDAISAQSGIWLLFSCFFAIIFLLSAVIHWFGKKRTTDQLFQLSFLLMYSFFNIVIYFLKF